jgi:hypothetical protein
MKQKIDLRTPPTRTQAPTKTFANAGLPLPPPVTPPLEYAGCNGLKNGVPQGKETGVPPLAGGRRPRRGMGT